MSTSSSSTTESASSPEPPPKRQKAVYPDAYTDLILFQARGKSVGSVPWATYEEHQDEVFTDEFHDEANWGSISMTKEGRYSKVTRFRTLNFEASEDVVIFLVYWLCHHNANAAVKNIPSVRNCDKAWTEMFIEVLEFLIHNRISFAPDIEDSLIDSFIVRVKEDHIIKGISVTMESVDIIYSRAQLDVRRRIRSILAVLYLHHNDEYVFESISSQDGADGPEVEVKKAPWRLATLNAKMFREVKDRAMDLMGSAWKGREWSKMPKDILARDFDGHCLYHRHGEDRSCYRTKE